MAAASTFPLSLRQPAVPPHPERLRRPPSPSRWDWKLARQESSSRYTIYTQCMTSACGAESEITEDQIVQIKTGSFWFWNFYFIFLTCEEGGRVPAQRDSSKAALRDLWFSGYWTHTDALKRAGEALWAVVLHYHLFFRSLECTGIDDARKQFVFIRLSGCFSESCISN